MKFIISTTNIKLFAKSILALSKIGDEIYVEPREDALSLRTVNSSRSAFSCFSFKQSFFTYFDPDTSKGNSNMANQTMDTSLANISVNKKSRVNNNESVMDDSEPFKCKVPAKSLVSIFKNINSIEKNVEKCTITVKYIPLSQESAAKAYDYDSSVMVKMVNQNNETVLYDTKFLIIMSCKHGLRKTFILSISDCENLQAAFLPSNCTNKLSISAKYLHETINSFSNETEEVSFLVEADKLSIKNYVEPENSESKSLVNTQVSFGIDEFNSYEIEKETDITFCLKEFKVCLMFGSWFDLPLNIYFKHKGRPIILNYSNSNILEASFTFATLMDDASTTQNSSLASNLSDKNNKSENNFIRMKSTAAQNKIDKNNSKGNKRKLYDASNNQSYLDCSVDQNESRVDKGFGGDVNNESAEEDALLTQALDQHQAQFDQTSNHQVVQCSPPNKKMKSLVQTLFEDNEDDSCQEMDTTKTRATKVTFASLLDDSNKSDSEPIEHETDKKSSIYIEETDSEDE